MTLPLFDFICLTEDEYPQSSQPISFGRGYQFASAPRGPDQIICRCSFPKGLWWFQDPYSYEFNHAANPRLNVGALKTFYENVRMYKPFQFNHPHRGLTIWRFNRPLIIPRIVDEPGPGGYDLYRIHQTGPFDVSLMLQPV